jgi:hypothetical protein
MNSIDTDIVHFRYLIGNINLLKNNSTSNHLYNRNKVTNVGNTYSDTCVANIYYSHLSSGQRKIFVESPNKFNNIISME